MKGRELKTFELRLSFFDSNEKVAKKRVKYPHPSKNSLAI